MTLDAVATAILHANFSTMEKKLLPASGAIRIHLRAKRVSAGVRRVKIGNLLPGKFSSRLIGRGTSSLNIRNSNRKGRKSGEEMTLPQHLKVREDALWPLSTHQMVSECGLGAAEVDKSYYGSAFLR